MLFHAIYILIKHFFIMKMMNSRLFFLFLFVSSHGCHFVKAHLRDTYINARILCSKPVIINLSFLFFSSFIFKIFEICFTKIELKDPCSYNLYIFGDVGVAHLKYPNSADLRKTSRMEILCFTLSSGIQVEVLLKWDFPHNYGDQPIRHSCISSNLWLRHTTCQERELAT